MQDSKVPVSKLRTVCDPASLKPIADRQESQAADFVGQKRAIDAISLAVRMPYPDFNLFVVGSDGTGRKRAVDLVVKQHAATLPLPDDWVYVNNFDQPHKPRAMCLPSGLAQKLRHEIQDLVNDLAVDIPAIFESDDYQTALRVIDEEFGGHQETAMADFAERAKAEDVALVRTPMGFMLAAIRDGEVLKSGEFEQLTAPEQKVIEEKIARLQVELSAILQEAPKIDRERRRQIAALNADMANEVVSARIQEAKAAFDGIEQIQAFLADLEQDMVNNPEIFLAVASSSEEGPFPESVGKFHDHPAFRRYAVNIMVSADESQSGGAQVVKEELPTLDRLNGRIEHASHMGTLSTDFTMIKPGALHRANNGFLILDARRILSEPLAWTSLKQALQSRSITITSMAERLSLVSTTSLEPDPIPLSIRVILIGDRLLHALLVALDPDFGELFKIEADFDESTERAPDMVQGLVGMLADRGRQRGLLALSEAGAARLIDEAVRLTEDSKKLSLHLGDLNDIMCEANQYAVDAGHAFIEADDIEASVEQKRRRASRIRNRMREAVRRGAIFIDTEGSVVGQVNGLSVVGLSGRRFGQPSRITARTRMGAGKLIDIEREVDLGGPLHSKGVLILGAYLSSTYAREVPFSLYASLVFEQSYGGVDGDSASAAELFALLSSLSGIGINQGFAVTGSINQNGQVQPIGGVNEKIEGFFETCQERGLTGTQGVLIPKANVDNLMLCQDVCDAVAQGQFHIHAISTIDQGLEILTDHEAGVRNAEGRFPAGSINALVEDRLVAFAKARLRFAREAKTEIDGKDQ